MKHMMIFVLSQQVAEEAQAPTDATPSATIPGENTSASPDTRGASAEDTLSQSEVAQQDVNLQDISRSFLSEEQSSCIEEKCADGSAQCIVNECGVKLNEESAAEFADCVNACEDDQCVTECGAIADSVIEDEEEEKEESFAIRAVFWN